MSEEGEEIEIVVKEKIKKVVNLELGDIIKIESDGNNEYHLKTFYINYIDNSKIKLINIANLKPELLIVFCAI